MSPKTYGIGELARLSGTPVRRIRFYSDRGLLPPIARTEGNYRIYTNDDLARLQLIRSLRTAGIELARIAEVITRRLPVMDVLRAQLSILEIEMSAQARMATAIRATLSLPCPTEDDFRKVLTMLNVSNEEMKTKISDYVNYISDKSSIDDRNLQILIGFYSCEIPDRPTVEQLEIWNKIATLLDDDDLRKSSNINTKLLYPNYIKDLYPSRAELVDHMNRSKAVMDPLEKAWKADESSNSKQVQELLGKFITFEAQTQEINNDKIIEEYFFMQKCVENNKSSKYLLSLIRQLRGDPPKEHLQNPPLEFWSWFYDALIVQRDQTRLDRDGPCRKPVAFTPR